MAPIMPMSPDSELPDGPDRDCAGELRRCCRAAGCPGLRQVSRAAEGREDLRASQPGAFCPHPGRGGGPGLAVGVRRGAGHVLVTVAGEVDSATVPGLRGQLVALAAGGRPLIADLDRAGFIDAAGLGVLAAGARPGGPPRTTMAAAIAGRAWPAGGRVQRMDRGRRACGTRAGTGFAPGRGRQAGASRRLRTTRLEDGEGPAR